MRRVKSVNVIILVVLCVIALAGSYSLSRHDASAATNTDKKPIEQSTTQEPAFFDKDFSFVDTKGKKHNIYDYKDKRFIVHFWATWCGPCVEELPTLLRRMAISPDVTLIAFSTDQQEATMNNFLKTLKVKTDLPNVIFVWDKDNVVTEQVFNVTTYPETFLFEKNLDMALHIEGTADWDAIQTK